MKINDILRRIVYLSLIFTLITSAFVNLPLSISAEGEGLQGGQSNIVNGSFEDPDSYRIEDLAKGTPSCYKYAPQNDVLGWKTTSTTSQIELGWMNHNASIDKASPHMKPTIAKASYTADGYQLAEIIASETSSSLYQKITVTESKNYNWTVHHRGRSGVDTLALIITDYAGSVYDKSKSGAIDHFNQILNWLKNTNGVTAPEDGKTETHTVYTTELIGNSSFDGEEANWFSNTQDENHTVKFEIHLISTGTSRWGEYTGSYTSDENKDILFVLSPFQTSFSKDDGGNLIDKTSFVDEGGNNLLLNPSFDDVNANNNYKNFPAANATATTPTEGIGWSTTSYARVIEIGNFENGNVYGITAVQTVLNEPYIRDGEQFAELNADEESSLYQIVNTVPGKMYKWSLSHRGRDGIDTMALIIGPNQTYAPKKKANNKTNRDQLMQIIDWLYSQTEMPLDLPTGVGCSDKIKVYTPKFNSNGGWTEDSNIFSFYKDSIHTEEWSVWIIASKNDKWYDYGELDTSATYSYECVIPEGQNNAIFGFVSHSSYKSDGTKNSMSYGNLLDNIAFKEYYYAKVEVAMNNAHGHAYITSGEKDSIIWDDENSQLNGWALHGSSLTIHVQPTNREFIGAYINGVFHPYTGDDTDEWEYDAVKNEHYYTFPSVEAAIKVTIIFSAQKIYYDSRSENIYQYKAVIDDETGNIIRYEDGPEVPMSLGDRTIYKSHAPQKDDGWEFVGWKYINPKDSKETIFDEVHTVTLEGDTEKTQTFTVTDGTNTIEGISYNEGITFLGEWKYRQRVVAQTYDGTKYVESIVGGKVDIVISHGGSGEADEIATDYIDANDNTVGKELNSYADDTNVTVTAKREAGYTFNGWYDSSGKLISKNASYVYKVKSGVIETLYAHFDPAGCNLKIDCSVYSSEQGDTDKSFDIKCVLSGLRTGKLYTLSYVSGETITNHSFEAEADGKATVTLTMKHRDYAEFIYLPVDSTYIIEADPEISVGFLIKGEVKTEKTVAKPVGSTEAVPVLTEHIIFFKVSQSALIKHGKHYQGITEDEEIKITPNSSYTLDVETRYNPSFYENLSASLCFYDLSGNAKSFIDKTRILMIDLSSGEAPKYYGYTVNGEINTIPLTDFTELGSSSAKFTIKTGNMQTEKLVFIVDYVDTGDLAESGKVSLVYNDTNNELNSILNPSKKTVNIGEDTTGITADVGDGKASRDGPFAINITIKESSPYVNTTYKEDDFTKDSKYAVKLSVVDGSLPDGSYAKVGENKYFLNNGYIKIPSLSAGPCKVNVYSPVPISNDTVTFNATLSDSVSASPEIPAEKTVTVQFNCVTVAMDADVVNKVLNPGSVSSVDVKFKHSYLDSVGLTVYEKGSSTPITAAEVNNPVENGNIKFSFENGFTAVSGKTYIFSFVGYVNGAPVLEDKCTVVGGYVLKNN